MRDRARIGSRHAKRRGEGGFALTESIVTIAIMGIAVVGIGAGLAQTHRMAAINQDQSQLEVAMRQLSDFVRDSSSQGLGYHVCASPATYNAAGLLPAPPAGVTSWSVSGVSLSTAATRSGVAVPPLPGGYCVTNGTCTAAKPCDWGVQEITLAVSDGSRTLTRTVWKSKSW